MTERPLKLDNQHRIGSDMVRGVAAIEMAKSDSELELAANEFRRATELDPAIGTEVVLSVLHDGAEQPAEMRVKRGEFAEYLPKSAD